MQAVSWVSGAAEQGGGRVLLRGGPWAAVGGPSSGEATQLSRKWRKVFG